MKPGQNGKLRPRGRMNNGGKKHMPQRNQTYDSNGPDVRIRGNAHQVLEKYLTMARDASSQGDRIAAENYYQHAEHYFRVINSQNQNQMRFGPRPLSTPADDQAPLPGDGEGEDEDVAAAAAQREGQPAPAHAVAGEHSHPVEAGGDVERPDRFNA